MSAILAFLMTGVITFINTGLNAGFPPPGPHVRALAERLCARDGWCSASPSMEHCLLVMQVGLQADLSG